MGLASNRFEGHLPLWSNVTELHLEDNKLSGSIPENISQLISLGKLNLSHNRFSGHIPEGLASLNSLSQLDLSYNNLAGRIPARLKFKESSIYEGNPFLCGPPRFMRNHKDEFPCPGQEQSNQSKIHHALSQNKISVKCAT
ncbi:hypothetical protein ACFE04_000557 [Oxalis oulophora]